MRETHPWPRSRPNEGDVSSDTHDLVTKLTKAPFDKSGGRINCVVSAVATNPHWSIALQRRYTID